MSVLCLVAVALGVASMLAQASSHREAPLIIELPKVDGTDGSGNNSKRVSVPLINIGPLGPGVGDTANLNIAETYTLTLVRGNRRSGQAQVITNANTGASTFAKPVDNIGTKSIPNYETYARNHIYPISIPGCAATGGRVFVGQRRESFFVNLGDVFDLVNLSNPVGEQFADAGKNILDDVNITTPRRWGTSTSSSGALRTPRNNTPWSNTSVISTPLIRPCTIVHWPSSTSTTIASLMRPWYWRRES